MGRTRVRERKNKGNAGLGNERKTRTQESDVGQLVTAIRESRKRRNEQLCHFCGRDCQGTGG